MLNGDVLAWLQARRAALGAAALFGIVSVSLSPRSPLDLLAHAGDGGLAHTAAYSLVTMALLLLRSPARWAAVCAGLFALGAGLEYLQRYLPGRCADPGDIVSNGLGILAGWTLAGLILALVTAPGRQPLEIPASATSRRTDRR